MGHGYARPIVGTTPTGVGIHYIILNRYAENVRIETSVNGTVTDYDVDWTIDNIMFDATALKAVNLQPNAERVAPTDATWIVTTINAASGSDALEFSRPVFALRVNLIAGTGSVTYRILQAT
jgi:hypothetical protein